MIPSLLLRPSFFPSVRASLRTAACCAATCLAVLSLPAAAFSQAPQTVPMPTPQTTTTTDGQNTTTTSTTTDQTGKPVQSVTTTHTFGRGKKKADKDGKVVQSKDTRKAASKNQKLDALAGVDSKLPDKQLYDKAVVAIKKGHFDVARLDLQTMLNTYPDSQYQMRAKLAIADSWYKEGGTAALTQAEQEYSDFRVFFPNVPEAAEAQMRIGDIYFRQMDKPDRDYAKALHAEEEYRRMLTDYPDSTLIPQAKQRLREVQEVLADRESTIAGYYATRENWAATIARYQTVEDTFPLYSHMDDVLIGLGDAYGAQARYIRTLKLPEAGKAKLEKTYDGLAASCYRKVVMEHAASAHVEDARDRLAAMNMPIPEPTKDQIAASQALEDSRATYRLTDRVQFMFLHKPDTVTAARIGEPSMADPKPTYAPDVRKKVEADFKTAFNEGAPAAPAPVTTAASPSETPQPTAPAAPAAPLAFQDVGTASGGASSGGSSELTAAPASTGGGTNVGVEILNGATPRTLPAATGTPDPNNGLTSVGPTNNTPLPEVERAAPDPGAVNEVSAPTPAAQTPNANGKNGKPAFDKSDESSSKHKKKGLKKIVPPNPF